MTTVLQFAERGLAAESAILSRVRLRAHRRSLWLRELWSPDEQIQHVAITDNEADRLLADPAGLQHAELAYYDTNSQARELGAMIAHADARAKSDGRWRALQQLFNLRQAESDLLALAMVVMADPTFGRACAYLQDDATACYATPLLAAALFGWTRETHITSNSNVLRWKLASVSEQSGLAPNSAWAADAHIVQWLLGGHGFDPVLGSSVELMRASEVAPLLALHPVPQVNIREFIDDVSRLSSAPIPIEIELVAPQGAGKRTLAGQACAAAETDLLVADVDALQLQEQPYSRRLELIVHVAREARLHAAAVYWQHSDTFDARTRSMLAGMCDVTFFGYENPPQRAADSRVARCSFDVPSLQSQQRVQLWQHYAAEPVPEPIANWQLRPSEIRAAAQLATAGPAAVLSACRRMLQPETGDLLTSLECPYTWGDIVLSVDARAQLEELSAQARLRDGVLNDWGFDRLCRTGRGISALFAGPSGTGKTMAAQIVARDLNRQLLRVDLAGVVNKYIGETEKRLKRVFDMCERSAVVLFFDEADALFGQRTQVKDAHDRYANIQIDYLLQRMEQFDGIAILASNRKNDLDSAFVRRLRFIVDFLPPGPSERLTLWHLALPERSPSGAQLLDEIDWDWLADKLNMTGADIKATALAAAFLARARCSRIGMQDLLHAARRQMIKHGAAWQAGDWMARSYG